MSKERGPKVLTIGLDGATFDILNPMIKKGLLSNLAGLMERGASGVLNSVIPPMSGPAWVSFMTGKNPGRHGIYDFHCFLSERSGKRVVNFNDIRARSLWEVLTERGKKSGVLNLPVTYPPYPVDGFMISGLLTPPGAAERRMYPESLYGELKAKFGEYIADVWWMQYRKRKKADLLRDLIRSLEQKHEMISYLMREKEWDFMMTTITETDRLQHAFGDYFFPVDRPEGKDPVIEALLERFYIRLDEQVGRLCREAGEETSVFIVSDHGFGEVRDFFLINRWLQAEGLLEIKEWTYAKNLAGQALKNSIAGSAIAKTIIRNLEPYRIDRRFRNLSEKSTDGGSAGTSEYRSLFSDCIDWSKTQAYMDLDDQQGIHVNLKGREVCGIVEPADYEKTRERLIKLLGKVIHPQTRKPLATYVKRREEVYSGEHLDQAPDLILCFDNFKTYGIGLLSLSFFKRGFFHKPIWPAFSAHHRMEGIFIAAGPMIRKGLKTQADLIDVFPTILYALDESIPDDLDGKLLDDIFVEGYRAVHPVRYEGSSEKNWREEQPQSLEENEKITESLRGLGYL